MYVMLAYDLPDSRHQTLMRKEFERLGGTRVQYSIYVFEGEPHECERVIRYMRRVALEVEGDVRLFPMERTVWDAQMLLCSPGELTPQRLAYAAFVKIWESQLPHSEGVGATT